ncbi:MlaD family protein [Geminicoccaceae bacterium 1502E]|nr:MlaD family protein [Geminicoccaceae bacterium 1502E]
MAEPELHRRRGIPLIWTVPLVAVLLGLWLTYATIQRRGPVVDIVFQTAEGLEAGKTKVRYRDVEVGLVEDIGVSENLENIQMRVRIHPEFATHLTTSTRFWVVRPRVGGGGISGLDTLFSGAYVEVDPGDGAGESASSFVGLEEPPLIRSGAPGTRYLLQAESLRSVSRGAPVFYRGIEAGQVLGFGLGEDDQSVEVVVFVRKPYDRLVHARSQFWNAGGIAVETGAEGLKVRMNSVQSLLVGGIEFDTPDLTDGEPAPPDTAFALHPDKSSVAEAQFTRGVPFLLRFAGSLRGLRPGAPVEVRGIKVGRVRSFELTYDADDRAIEIPVLIDLQPERIAIFGRQGEESDERVYETIDKLVAEGLRAQLVTGNLLTGELLVQLGFHDDAPPARLDRGGVHPRIPSVPTTLESITETVERILARMQGLPLEPLVSDMRTAVQAANALLRSPEIGGVLAETRDAAAAARAAAKQADDTLASLDEMMGGRSGLRYQMTTAMEEISAAARALRSLAQYFERNPDALIRGKRGGR